MTELNRWRLVLGEDADPQQEVTLQSEEKELDQLMAGIYNGREGHQFGRSGQKIRKWLDGIRNHFPGDIVQIMQRDALERQHLKEMLLEPELLEKIEPNVQMVAAILQLQELLPDKTKAAARQLVQKLSAEIEKKLRLPMQTALQKAKSRHSRHMHPANAHIDWKKTIIRNLKNYQSEIQTIVPDKWYGFKKGNQLPEVFIVVDKSESMVTSAIYASIIGAVLASLRSVQTHIVFFDTEITDVTGLYHDPVDIMFSVPMGGGTDIAQALQYVNQKIKNPKSTILFLISDLYEGGNKKEMMLWCEYLLSRGGRMLSLLCLDDEGRPDYDHDIAHQLAQKKIPCFACSPEKFPELLGEELEKIV